MEINELKEKKRSGKIRVKGVRVQDYINKEWRYRKRGRHKKDNPISLARDMMIRFNIYPHNKVDRQWWDKHLGKLYLYADEKIEGFIIENSSGKNSIINSLKT